MSIKWVNPVNGYSKFEINPEEMISGLKKTTMKNHTLVPLLKLFTIQCNPGFGTPFFEKCPKKRICHKK